MLIEYIRGENRNPVGCIVAIDRNTFGISLLNPKDEFDKDMAKKIAIGRAELGVYPNIPRKKESLVERSIQRMVDRADRYFKKEVEQKSIKMTRAIRDSKLISIER